MSASPEFLTRFLGRFASRGLQLGPRGKLGDEHQAFFIVMRANFLVGKVPEWADEGLGTNVLSLRILKELFAIDTYLRVMLGPNGESGFLGGASETGSPGPGSPASELSVSRSFHLHLADLARTKQTTSNQDADKRTAGLVALRRRLVLSIVWRTAALDASVLPFDAASPETVALAHNVLNELLDRRLRTIERMNTQVATHSHINGFYYFDQETGGGTFVTSPAAKLNTPNAGSGWFDSFRVRPFEYPRLYLNPSKSVGVYAPRIIQGIGAANILAEDRESFVEGESLWQYGTGHVRVQYNDGAPIPQPPLPPPPAPPPDPIRCQLFKTRSPASWRQRDKQYELGAPLKRKAADVWYDINLTFNPSLSYAQAVDDLLSAKFDWWERSWLFCDHVMSALNTESLLFWLRRRDFSGPNPDQKFNDLAHRPTPPGPNEYVQLTHHLSLTAKLGPGNTVVRPVLMDGNPTPAVNPDPYFDNTIAFPKTMIAGDLVLFANSFVHTFLADDEWRFEYALVLDAPSNSNPKSEGIFRSKLLLIGHGVEARLYPEYLKRVADSFAEKLKRVQARALATADSRFELPVHRATQVIRWDPFNEFTSGPPPWWLILKDEQFTPENVEEKRDDIPRSLLVSDVQSPTTPFPIDLVRAPGVLFLLYPLFEPRMPWRSYFESRSDPNFTKPTRLSPVKVSGSDIPGIFQEARSTAFKVIGPKAGGP